MLNKLNQEDIVQFTKHNVSFLPIPNRQEIIFTKNVPPLNLSTTAFVVPFMDDGRIVLVNNRVRGRLEIPGGHIEKDETAIEAAIRETLEEVGCKVLNPIQFALERLVCLGQKPLEYKYPYPISYQVFHIARVKKVLPFKPNQECDMPVFLSMSEFSDNLGISENSMFLIKHAYELMLNSQEI